MSLQPGEKLGPYEILSPIGAGGMGEVYKARDTRLDRTVAIKVLPEHIAKREDLRARFEREARAVASLNHPHICTLHDIGSGYMVMELIEGETLAARIEKGALPLDQALKFAEQIADALDRAHRAGVTHRDIKPQNIMLTRDGVKVLDFGLAKSAANPGPTEATLTKVLTTEGTVMGTPQYMAPEQFEGKEADARSDIWAFGAVLYEMATGQKAFQGKSYSSLVGAILSADPAPMAVKPFTPEWLERLVRRCLNKDPEDRYHCMRDIVLDLRMPPPETGAAGPAKTSRWPLSLAGALALALIATGVGWYTSATRSAILPPLIRLNAEIDSATPLVRTGADTRTIAISPDGTRLALTLRAADGKIRLFTRLLHQSQVTPLAATEDAGYPFFSPDGAWIAFFAGGKLKKVAVEGGAAVALCDAPNPRGASWSDDGNIIAALESAGGLSRIPPSGGAPVLITRLSTSEATHRWPYVLPGGHAVLFSVSSQIPNPAETAHIEALSLRTGQRTTILPAGFSSEYVPATTGIGHLVYLQETTLFAVPFDPVRLAITGVPAPILDDAGSSLRGGGDFALARNGTFVYLPGPGPQSSNPISWVSAAGPSQPLHAPPGRYNSPRFSPDGKRLAFAMGSGNASDIWVKDLDRDTPSRLSFLPGVNSHPVWTPDGKLVVFRSGNRAAPGIYATRSDGSGEAKRLTEGKPLEYPDAFSPDGKRLAFSVPGNGGRMDIFIAPVEADSGPGASGIRLGNAEPFLATPFLETGARFSPDGRWLAYSSDESGTPEVYVRPFPGPGGRWQISTAGGIRPIWSRDGRELLFLALDRRVMVVSYSASGDSLVAARPRVWAEARLRTAALLPNYDLAPDGKRLAAILAEDALDAKPLTHLTFLLNFAGELQRKAPPGK